MPSSSLEIDHDNIMYYLINTNLMSDGDVLLLLNSIKNNEKIAITHDLGFLNRPTIYKLKDVD